MENLTALENVKSWLNVTTPNEDVILTTLIAQASRTILTFIQRDTLLKATQTEMFDGVGNTRIFPRLFPILSVSTMKIGAISVQALSDPTTEAGCGYLLDAWNGRPPGKPQAVTVRGYCFPRGESNVSLTYTSGYVQAEARTAPSTSPYQVTPSQPYGIWAADNGVTYADGTAMTPVASDSEVTGKYSVTNGVYTFAAGDSGAAILLTYSYIPYDIERACIDLVAEIYKYRNRIGQNSTTLAGQQTASYKQKQMTDDILARLQPYKNVVT